MSARFRIGVTLCLGAFAAAVYAATALRFGAEINVSGTPTPTEKAKVVRLAYVYGGAFRKAWLFTYGDGPSINRTFSPGIPLTRARPGRRPYCCRAMRPARQRAARRSRPGTP